MPRPIELYEHVRKPPPRSTARAGLTYLGRLACLTALVAGAVVGRGAGRTVWRSGGDELDAIAAGLIAGGLVTLGGVTAGLLLLGFGRALALAERRDVQLRALVAASADPNGVLRGYDEALRLGLTSEGTAAAEDVDRQRSTPVSAARRDAPPDAAERDLAADDDGGDEGQGYGL